MVDSSARDLDLVCGDLRDVEKDLAFEIVESYRERRAEDFADALLALQSLVVVVDRLCKKE